ncbi:hypothetical protein D3C73_1471460 [compost metagenome]
MSLVVFIRLHIVEQILVKAVVSLIVQQVLVLIPVKHLDRHVCSNPFYLGGLWNDIGCCIHVLASADVNSLCFEPLMNLKWFYTAFIFFYTHLTKVLRAEVFSFLKVKVHSRYS